MEGFGMFPLRLSFQSGAKKHGLEPSQAEEGLEQGLSIFLD